MRDRSVVRSSVMPSAKYSWSGSRDRFSKGSTTKDKCGAGVFAMVGATCAAGECTAGVDGVPLGHVHQTASAMHIIATALVGTMRRRIRLARPRGARAETSGVDATAAALIA